MEKERRQSKGGLSPASSRGVGASIYIIFPSNKRCQIRILGLLRGRLMSVHCLLLSLNFSYVVTIPCGKKMAVFNLPVAISFPTEDYFTVLFNYYLCLCCWHFANKLF